MKKNIKKPSKAHDSFYRISMGHNEVAKEFFAKNLPSNLLKRIDLNSLKPEKDTFVDVVNKKLKLSASDALFSVKFDGEDGYIYLLAEHQTKVDHFIALRLLKYMLSICEQHIAKQGTKCKHLPIIVPILYYTGKKKYTAPLRFFDLFKEAQLAKTCFTDPYTLIDLHRSSNEEIRETIWLGVMLFIMKHVQAKDILPYLIEIKPMLREVGEKKLIYFEAIFRYIIEYTNTNDQENVDKVLEVLTNITPEEHRDKFMSIADRLIERGIEKGKLEGKLEGLSEGRREEKYNIAMNMISKGQEIGFISEITGLSKEEIQEITKKVTKH